MITPEMTAPYVLGLLKCVRYETKHWLDRVPVLSGAKVSIIYGFGKITRPKNFAGILQRQNDTPRQKFRSALRRPSTRPDGHRAFLRKPPPPSPTGKSTALSKSGEGRSTLLPALSGRSESIPVAPVTAALIGSVTTPVAALGLRTGLIDVDSPLVELETVQRVNRVPCGDSSGISTKPKPRERPVSRSVMMLAEDTSPYSPNKVCKLSPRVRKFKFDT